MANQSFNTSSLDGTNGFKIINSNNIDDRLGFSVNNTGDINGDGINDIIIGSPLANPNDQNNGGKTYIVFGSLQGFPATVDLANLDGINGFTVFGNLEGDESGRSVSSAGDINGDGIDDLIIGAPFADSNNTDNKVGFSYVIFGKRSFSSNPIIEVSNLNGDNGFQIQGVAAQDELGYSVSSAGDINNDGFDDLIIGAPNADFAIPNGQPGKTYVVFGQSNFNANFNLNNLNGSNGFVINGKSADDFSGLSVSSAGDVNNDGIDDLIIGTPQSNTNGTNSGQAYIVFGKERNFTPNLDIDSLDGSNGFVINGVEDSKLGYSVNNIGDVNNDGIDDIIIGARDNDPNGVTNAGTAYVIFGKDGNFDAEFDISSLDGTNGFTVNAISGYENLGLSVSGVGDVSGDGIDDFIVSANNFNADGEMLGASYVVFGSNNFNAAINVDEIDGTNGFVVEGKLPGDRLGLAVSGGGDVNGDGVSDLIIGTPLSSGNVGELDVIYGVNNAPTDLSLNNTAINENAGDNAVIGQFSTTDPNAKVQSFTYTLDASFGDNEAFVIEGDTLKIKQSPDFETKSSYQIKVRTTDQGGSAYEKEFTININDVDENGGNQNSAPTDLTLNNTAVAENIGDNSVIGQFSTTDPDAGNTFTYSLTVDFGDNEAFVIDGDTLKIKQSPDFETKSSYQIKVRTTDQDGFGYEKEFTININDVDENGGNQNSAPTDLSLTNIVIDENVGDNAVVGQFSTTDPDAGNSFTYSLESGVGDNEAFVIDGDNLRIKQSPDFETKSSYNINVITTDQHGLSLNKQFTINVNDVDENGGNNGGNNGGGQPVVATRLVQISDDVFNIESSNNTATLEVQLAGKGSNDVNELAVFTVDDGNGTIDGIAAGETGYTEAAIARSKVIFSTISDIPNQFDITDINKLLGFNANENLRFYVVENGSTDSVQAGITPLSNVIFPESSTLQVTEVSENNFSLGWEYDSANGTVFDDLIVNITATDNPLPLGTDLQENPQGESIDLRDINGPVNAEFTVYREAAFNNYIGFYQVTDENGGIDVDGDGVADLSPGESGYTQAAVNQHLSSFGLTVGDEQTATFTGTLEGGGIYVPFLIVDGNPDAILDGNAGNDPDVFFTYLGANSDGVDHVRMLGDNTFGFEDLVGGGDGDFNDMIVEVNLSAIA